MANQKYNEWRDAQVKRVGLHTQLAAEAHLERHDADPLIEVNNDKGGQRQLLKSAVADRLALRKEVSYPKKYFGGIDIPKGND